MFWPYVAPLLVICSLAIMGSGPMLRTGVAIFLNWIAGTAFVYATNIYDPWLFNILIDAAAARIILHQPAGQIQSLIGATYMAQIVFHVIYAFSDHSVGAYTYWEALTATAFLQLLLLGGWIGVHGHRIIRERRNPRLAGTASTTGMGTW